MFAEHTILVIRFSAMGDVAMVASVLKEFRINYPEKQLVIVSRKTFKPFFEGIENVRFHVMDPATHKGLTGIWKLFRELSAYQITHVADLHNNLRSKVLRNFFLLRSAKTAVIDKGREEKHKLTRKHAKVLTPLKSTLQRYVDVFTALHFEFTFKNKLKKDETTKRTPSIKELIGETTQKLVGISPFAKHPMKVYPLSKMEHIVNELADKNVRLFIFGGSAEEQIVAENWERSHKNITSLVKKINLSEELELISNLDLMVSMDSAGMHLASLKGIPVISVWGATHPFAGFIGYGQDLDRAVQIDLECRPCSVFGNKPCFRGDFACMNFLPETLILNKIYETLNYG